VFLINTSKLCESLRMAGHLSSPRTAPPPPLSRSCSSRLAVPRRSVGWLRIPTPLMAALPRWSRPIGMPCSRWPRRSRLPLCRRSRKLLSGHHFGCVQWCAAPRRGGALTSMAGRWGAQTGTSSGCSARPHRQVPEDLWGSASTACMAPTVPLSTSG
jgi:hypothetical protein